MKGIKVATVIGAMFLLGTLGICKEIRTTARIRGLRRYLRNGAQSSRLPVTAAGTGRSISASSGWRASLSSLANRWKKISNSTEDWKAIIKNSTSSSRRKEGGFVGSILPSPRTVKHPKKTQIIKPVIGSIKKKSTVKNQVPVLSFVTTTEATETTEEPPLERVPISKTGKNYVQIKRKKTRVDPEKNNTEVPATPRKRDYRVSIKANLESESGRGLMRRNGQIHEYPHHQHQFPAHSHQKQQYLPLPQQHGDFIDPYHPSIQHSLNQPPHNPLHVHHQPSPGYSDPHHPFSKHDPPHSSLVPLDKTLVYVAMIATWIFWIAAFTTYYSLWGPHGRIHKHGGPTVTVEDSHGKKGTDNESPSHVIHTR